MNQRIKELAEQQAGSILMDLIMPDAGIPERIKWNIGCTAEHLEKFAELIIEDMHRKVIASILITDVVMEEKGQVPTSEDYIRAINNDFGVEK